MGQDFVTNKYKKEKKISHKKKHGTNFYYWWRYKKKLRENNLLMININDMEQPFAIDIYITQDKYVSLKY